MNCEGEKEADVLKKKGGDELNLYEGYLGKKGWADRLLSSAE